MIPTQRISRGILDAATEALGGAPSRPPLPVAPSLPTAAAAAREAFTAANLEPVAPAAPRAIGHPTFDPTPAQLAGRSEKVGIVRNRLATLIRIIQQDHADLQPIIAELRKDSTTVIAAEAFDPKVAAKFLTDLEAIVNAIAPKPKAPPEITTPSA